MRAPADQGFFVAPGGQRHQPSLPRPAAEAVIGDEAVDTGKLRAQRGGMGEVGVPVFGPGVDLEDHDEHAAASVAGLREGW